MLLLSNSPGTFLFSPLYTKGLCLLLMLPLLEAALNAFMVKVNLPLGGLSQSGGKMRLGFFSRRPHALAPREILQQ